MPEWTTCARSQQNRKLDPYSHGRQSAINPSSPSLVAEILLSGLVTLSVALFVSWVVGLAGQEVRWTMALLSGGACWLGAASGGLTAAVMPNILPGFRYLAGMAVRMAFPLGLLTFLSLRFETPSAGMVFVVFSSYVAAQCVEAIICIRRARYGSIHWNTKVA